MNNHVSLAAVRLGYFAAISTVGTTIVTFGIAILTPPVSGPNCTEDCIEYPYLEAVERFPRDYWWMYPAMLLMAIFFVLMVSIHHYADPEKKVFSHIGVSFALMSTTVLVVNYFVQVSVIQPSLDSGETEGIAILTQYNSHGMFIVLEEIGYLMMSVGFLFMAPVFAGKGRVERAICWLFVLSFVLTVIALTAVSLIHGIVRSDSFEIAVISIDWLALIVTGILLRIVFRRAMNDAVSIRS